jgi:prepilin signal peptidase PulO-like enzyme (type II secretory pathway)
MPNPLAGSQNAPADFETRYADASGGAASLARNPAQGSGAGLSGPNGRGGSANGATPFLPGVRIAADPVNNTLLIYANPENYRIIAQTLQQIDRPQLQVAIDATIAEVTLNNKLNYGVQFFLKSSDVGLGTDKGSIINSIGNSLLAQTFPGFNFLIGSQAQPRLILDALHQVTDVKVLSNPSVVVLDNQVATLQVGDQIPITTGTATVLNSSNQVVSTIDYRPTGIILRVVPRVNVNGNVVLDIEQEVSNVTNPDNPTLTPTVSQRRVKSSIAVANGQTVLLAGLISEQRTNERSGIPFLDQLPNLGDAFAHQNRTAGRTELIMFIRPQVIRDGADARRVAEELRAKMPAFAPPAAAARDQGAQMSGQRSLDCGIGRAEGASDAAIRGELKVTDPALRAGRPALHAGYEIAFVALAAIAAVVVSLRVAHGMIGLLGAALALVMLAIALIDRRRFVIPDSLSALGLILGVFHALALEPDALVSAVALAAARGAALALIFLAVRSGYARLRGRQGLGLGDVKLAGVAGTWLDWSMMAIAVELAAVAALSFYLFRVGVLGQPFSAAHRLPFGLFLAPAVWLCWVFQSSI